LFNVSSTDITERLCALGESQLQMQTSRSAVLEAGALGIITADIAFAMGAVSSAPPELWIAALALFSLSLSLAVRVVRLPNARQSGPSVQETLDTLDTQDKPELERSLAQRFARDIRRNEQALARKTALFERAVTFLVLAATIELAGRL
jgi:hypothetical protein